MTIFNYSYTKHMPQYSLRMSMQMRSTVLVLLEIVLHLLVSWVLLGLIFDNGDNKITFFGNIVYFHPCIVICGFALRARAAKGTTRAQINNIPKTSHFTPLLLGPVYKQVG